MNVCNFRLNQIVNTMLYKNNLSMYVHYKKILTDDLLVVHICLIVKYRKFVHLYEKAIVLSQFQPVHKGTECVSKLETRHGVPENRR